MRYQMCCQCHLFRCENWWKYVSGQENDGAIVSHAEDEMAPLALGNGPPNTTVTLSPVKRAILWIISSRCAGSSSIALKCQKDE
jgi:hypothetical protein